MSNSSVSISEMSKKRKRGAKINYDGDEQMDISRMDPFNQLRYLRAMATVRYTALESHKSVIGQINKITLSEFSDYKKLQLIRTLLRSMQINENQ